MIRCFDNILESVFCIEYGDSKATAFAVKCTDSSIGFLTCKHLFKSLSDGDDVEFALVQSGGNRQLFNGRLYLSDHEDAAFILVHNIDLVCLISFDDIIQLCHYGIGDEVFIIGFPFIFNGNVESSPFLWNGNSYPTGVFRHGYIASYGIVDAKKDHSLILLDLHNNHGFSGSMVFKKISCSNEFRYYPIGLISGYYLDKQNNNLDKGINSGLSYCSPFKNLIRHMIYILGADK